MRFFRYCKPRMEENCAIFGAELGSMLGLATGFGFSFVEIDEALKNPEPLAVPKAIATSYIVTHVAMFGGGLIGGYALGLRFGRVPAAIALPLGWQITEKIKNTVRKLIDAEPLSENLEEANEEPLETQNPDRVSP